MAHAAEDVGAELVVTADLDECERTAEVLLGYCVAAGIVRHPACHFGQSCGCREYGTVICPVAAAEQPGRDISLKVLGHARVQVPATDLQISRPEGLHGGGVRIMERTGADRYQLKGSAGSRQRCRRTRRLVSLAGAGALAGRQFEPQQFRRDTQDTCPVSQRVEIADRRPVLDAADLRLSESEPGTEKFLRNAIAAVFRDVERVPAVCPGDMAHVLGIKGVTERRTSARSRTVLRAVLRAVATSAAHRRRTARPRGRAPAACRTGSSEGRWRSSRSSLPTPERKQS